MKLGLTLHCNARRGRFEKKKKIDSLDVVGLSGNKKQFQDKNTTGFGDGKKNTAPRASNRILARNEIKNPSPARCRQNFDGHSFSERVYPVHRIRS